MIQKFVNQLQDLKFAATDMHDKLNKIESCLLSFVKTNMLSSTLQTDFSASMDLETKYLIIPKI